MSVILETDDLTAPEVLDDPYAYYGRLRESDPVHWNPFLKAWLVTRHDDVTWLIRNHELFSSEKTSPDPREAYPPVNEGDFDLVEQVDADLRGWVLDPGPKGFIDVDRPAHLEMRQAIHRWFTPKAVERWRGHLRETVKRLLDERRADGHMEVKNDFATPLPLTTICWMMEIPHDDAARLRDLVALFSLPGFAPDRLRNAVPAVLELQEYFEPLIEARAKDPGEDLVSMLADGERRGVFTRGECVSSAILLLAAGHETTLSLISNGLWTFIRQPEQWDVLRADPAGLCASATEECLRYEPSIFLMNRTSTQDVDVRGRAIRKDDRVIWVIPSANRDPRVFQDPDRFDITRSPNPHVAFGGGIHHCLGAALARVEGQEAFRGLAENVVRFYLDADTVEFVPEFFTRQLVSLPVSWN